MSDNNTVEKCFEISEKYRELAVIEADQNNLEKAYILYDLAIKKLIECYDLAEEDEKQIYHSRAAILVSKVCDLEDRGVIPVVVKAEKNDHAGKNLTPPTKTPAENCSKEDSFTEGEAAFRRHFLDVCNEKRSKKSWDDIFGCDDIKSEIEETIILPRKFTDDDSELSYSLAFFGPPGTGKTHIALTMATEMGFNFLPVKASDIQDKYIGQGPAKLIAAFQVAWEKSPCFMFFDEMDSAFPNRRNHPNSNSIVTEFLEQVNSVKDRMKNTNDRIFLCGATNLPKHVDEAVWRRFGKYIYIPLPTESERKMFLQKTFDEAILLQFENVHWECILEATKSFSNADLALLAMDIKGIPFRKACQAEYFKTYQQENQQGYIPCSSTDIYRIAMRLKDVPKGQFFPYF